MRTEDANREALAILKAKHDGPVGELAKTLEEVMSILETATLTTTATAWPEVMVVDQVADYLQVSRKAVYTMAQKGELPAAKIGDQWRFSRRMIDRWLMALSKQNYTGPALEGDNESM